MGSKFFFFILIWWNKQTRTFTQKALFLMQWLYFVELEVSMIPNISFVLHRASCISLGALCLPNIIWWSVIMFPHLETDNFSYHWNVRCALQIPPRTTGRKEQVYRSKRHALGNLGRMSNVINKIVLQLPLRTTSSNRPPRGNNKINYCSALKKKKKKITKRPFKKLFSQMFVGFFSVKVRVSRKYTFLFIKRTIKYFCKNLVFPPVKSKHLFEGFNWDANFKRFLH